MKFASAIFAVAIAAGVSATAIPEAEAYGNTLTNKVRRAADAFAEAVAGPEVLLDARCESEECFMARLKTRELASLVAMTVRDASPEAFIQSLGLRDETNLRRDADAWCTNHPGTICSKEKREAEAWCTNHPGTICAREAEAWCTNHPGTICQREASCFDAGAPCEKLKRAAEAVAKALAVEKRDAWCTNHPGTICGKEKREADAWCTNHPGTICAKEKREAEAWCTNHPGTICAKSKREADALASAWCTNHPGTICAKAKRDALTLASAANEIIAGLS